MANIGGNTMFVIQTKTTKQNEIGESEITWVDAFSYKGFLDLQSGDSDYLKHKTKLEESTHVFICDFHSGIYALADQDTRLICKGKVYDVLLIDNPMELNEQLEIYLRKVGAWNG